MCTEMTAGCTWPKSFFLQLHGESHMEYERKYENPGVMQNTAHGILMSNEGVPWTGPEIVRRLIPFQFNIPIPNEDVTLGARLRSEIPMILAKGALCYQTMLGEMEGSPLPLAVHLRNIGGQALIDAQANMLP